MPQITLTERICCGEYKLPGWFWNDILRTLYYPSATFSEETLANVRSGTPTTQPYRLLRQDCPTCPYLYMQQVNDSLQHVSRHIRMSDQSSCGNCEPLFRMRWRDSNGVVIFAGMDFEPYLPERRSAAW